MPTEVAIDLARMYQPEQWWSEAEEPIYRAIKLQVTNSRKMDANFIASFKNLGSILIKQDIFTEVGRRLSQFLESTVQVLSAEHPLTIILLLMSVIVDWELGQRAKARKTGLRLCKISSSVFGEGSLHHRELKLYCEDIENDKKMDNCLQQYLSHLGIHNMTLAASDERTVTTISDNYEQHNTRKQHFTTSRTPIESTTKGVTKATRKKTSTGRNVAKR